jgi:hypothetical protein
MICVRPMEEEDVPELQRIHAREGWNYRFPEVATPLFPVRTVAEDMGRTVIASVVKVEAEVYLWMDHTWGTPAERWEALQEMHKEVIERANRIGFDSLYCVLPPEIAKSFGPRLEELGWSPDRGWPRFTYQLR